MGITQSRRDFLASASLAAAAGLLGGAGSLAGEAPPEITTIRLGYWPRYSCLTPMTIAGDLLRAEGFTDVRYVPPSHIDSVARGEIDFDHEIAPWLVSQLDVGEPITVLAGLHVGCYELFAHEPIRTIADLKGKKVGIDYFGSGGHIYLSIMVAAVGLDPNSDIEWVANPLDWVDDPDTIILDRFAQKQVDAILTFPPEPQELRDRAIGRVILNTAVDAPWSHYFCCMPYCRSEFARDYPIATKRCLRAILKATDMCATEPELAARRLLASGFTGKYDHALETLTGLPYDRWRDYEPEDSLRFFALRLHEVGMIDSSPNTIIENGSDWHFLNELKREMKA